MHNIETLETLDNLTHLISELEYVTSPYDKSNLIREYPSLKELLKQVYSPRYIFNVTGDNVTIYRMSVDVDDEISDLTIYELLHKLHTRELTGHSALHECAKFINTYRMWEPAIVRILNKDLSCGIGLKTINEVYPGLIPEFSVPLAMEYKSTNVDFNKFQWFVSRKMNGIRCLCFIRRDGSVELISRNGIVFTTLARVEQEIKDMWLSTALLPTDIILDGEVCIVNDGIESFNGIVSEFRRKNHTVSNPLFYVFDMYTIDSFENRETSDSAFAVTYSILRSWFNSVLKDMKFVKLLPQTEVQQEGELEAVIESRPKNWEGLILRRGDHSIFKRSRRLQKIKSFKDLDAVVVGVDLGHKVIKGVDTLCVSAILINPFSDNIVRVGSGLSDEQRIQWIGGEKIVGKVVTVKYFEESSNKRGGRSLQFPTLKEVRDYE